MHLHKVDPARRVVGRVHLLELAHCLRAVKVRTNWVALYCLAYLLSSVRDGWQGDRTLSELVQQVRGLLTDVGLVEGTVRQAMQALVRTRFVEVDDAEAVDPCYRLVPYLCRIPCHRSPEQLRRQRQRATASLQQAVLTTMGGCPLCGQPTPVSVQEP